MLVKFPVVCYVKRGDVYRLNLPSQSVTTDRGIRNSSLHAGNVNVVVVSNDDVNQIKRVVLIAPITKAKREMYDHNGIGKVQYLANGAMYTIHCDEVRPVDKELLQQTNRLFALSDSLLDNIDSEILGMFRGHTLELPEESLSEEADNRQTPTQQQVLSAPAHKPIDQVGSRFLQALPEPEPAKPKETPSSVIVVTDKKVKPKEKKVKDKRIISDGWFVRAYRKCQSQDEFETLAQRLGITVKALVEKYNKLSNEYKFWSDDKKLEFVDAYEKVEAGKMDKKELLSKFNCSSMAAATKRYQQILK